MAIALGMSDEFVMDHTPAETLLVIHECRAEQKMQAEHREYCAAITASTLVNINRKKGAKAYSPQEFLALVQGRRPTDHLTPEQSWAEMKMWADRHNARLRAMGKL